jgi:hypothetical protein
MIAVSATEGTTRDWASRQVGSDPTLVSPGAISIRDSRKWLSQNMSLSVILRFATDFFVVTVRYETNRTRIVRKC